MSSLHTTHEKIQCLMSLKAIRQFCTLSLKCITPYFSFSLNLVYTLYKEIEREIKESAIKAIGIKVQEDLERSFKYTLPRWQSVVKVAESAIIKFADNVEDYNSYRDYYIIRLVH